MFVITVTIIYGVSTKPIPSSKKVKKSIWQRVWNLDEVSHGKHHSHSRCSGCGKKALQQGSIRKPQSNNVGWSRHNQHNIDKTTAVEIGLYQPTKQKKAEQVNCNSSYSFLQKKQMHQEIRGPESKVAQPEQYCRFWQGQYLQKESSQCYYATSSRLDR